MTLQMGRYAFVLVSMYRYSWLITYEIFRIFFIEGLVGGMYRIQTFLDFYIFFKYLQDPKYYRDMFLGDHAHGFAQSGNVCLETVYLRLLVTGHVSREYVESLLL